METTNILLENGDFALLENSDKLQAEGELVVGTQPIAAFSLQGVFETRHVKQTSVMGRSSVSRGRGKR